ncbi:MULTISPECIES: DMT family transporter [Comamonas]|uniref:Membrane protein n=1 Tax=Comamonas testosteroni TaxID=285 RepID=A0A096FKF1_COMTE|nr:MULTISPECIES: DMT family transporter [Comamonas]KGH30424.1 membrane protein [Comamonas testosteroni]MPT10869.1 DMT family transporter [Comamonas sp.]
MNTLRTSTHLGLIGMAALWGASWPWGRIVAQAMPPLAAASLRFFLAGLLLVLWLYRSGRMGALRVLEPRQWAGLACASAVGVLGYSVFFLQALKTVPAGKAAMVVALNPVLTMLFAALLFRERVNAIMCLGLALAVTGALYALSGGALGGLVSSSSGVGEWLLLGCAACWVAYTLIGRIVLTRVDALTTTTATALIGAALLLVGSIALEGSSAWAGLAKAPAAAWYSVVALALGATALAYAWYLKGVQELGAGAAAAYMSLVPLFGMLLSSFWLREPITSSLLGGGATAIFGMLLMNIGRIRLERAAHSAAA